MEIYESEEQQVEALKRWWKENGTSSLVGAGLAVAVVVGWNFWQSNRDSQLNRASAQYDQLMDALRAEKYESVDKMVEKISADFSSTPYAQYSALALAKSKVEQNDLEAAKSVLQTLMDQASDEEIKHVARLRLARLMLASKEYEKGLEIISQADLASSEGFSSSYDELTGDLYVALDRLGEARTAYQSAIRTGGLSPFLQFKLDDISAPELEQSVEP